RMVVLRGWSCAKIARHSCVRRASELVWPVKAPEMRPDEFTLVYDVVEEGLGWGPFFFLSVFLLMAGVGISGLTYMIRRKDLGGVVFFAIWLSLLALFGIVGVGNVLHQRLRCISWARTGAFQVTEGEVRFFAPAIHSNNEESFTVADVTFRYSASDFS